MTKTEKKRESEVIIYSPPKGGYIIIVRDQYTENSLALTDEELIKLYWLITQMSFD